MEGAIFLLQDDQTLIEMKEHAYDSEALLQKLLADYPSLLAGEQVNRAAPRRWLPVKREVGVPSKALGGNQWAIDNLFLDQEGIPTIVEVKRSSDTRISAKSSVRCLTMLLMQSRTGQLIVFVRYLKRPVGSVACNLMLSCLSSYR